MYNLTLACGHPDVWVSIRKYQGRFSMQSKILIAETCVVVLSYCSIFTAHAKDPPILSLMVRGQPASSHHTQFETPAACPRA
jgi:hypothetical protein